jgi:hypothetical protein
MLIWVALRCFFSGLAGSVIKVLVSNGKPLNDHGDEHRDEQKNADGHASGQDLDLDFFPVLPVPSSGKISS